MRAYMAWLAERRGLRLDCYDELWQWSVDQLDDFWASLWDYFDIRSSAPYAAVLADHAMPGARWFPGATLNYAEHALRAAERPRATPAMLLPRRRDPAAQPRSAGPNCAARSAAWPPSCAASASSPATGSAATCPTSRRPSSPSSPPPPSAPSGPPAPPTSAPAASSTASSRSSRVVLFAVDGYRYGGKDHDRRRDRAPSCARELPTLRAVVHIPLPRAAAEPAASEGALDWASPGRRDRRADFEPGALRPPAVGALLLGHHRPAQGDRPVPGRHPARAPQAAAACTSTSAPATASSGTPPPAG